MRAVIYARYSSDNQREESIDGQLRDCKNYAKYNDIEIVGEYIDRAMTAKSDNRPDFQRMIRDSYKDLFDVILVWKLDRFSRDRFDSAKYKAILRQNGVKVISATEKISDDASGILFESILEGYAEFYSVELAEKVKRGMTDNALKAKSNGVRAPFGYYVDENDQYQIDTETEPIVKEIYSLYVDGKRVNDIVKIMAERGVQNRNYPLNYNSVYRILTNRKYIGEYKFGDVVLEDGMPAIIDKETFEKVQKRFAVNKKAPSMRRMDEEYMLTTKLFCGHCGALMTGQSGTSHTQTRYHYYKCNRARKKECNKTSVRKKLIEDAVIDGILNLLKDELVLEDLSNRIYEMQYEQSYTLISLKSQLENVEKKLNNIVQALENGIFSNTTKQRLDELESQKEELEKQIFEEQSNNPFLTKEQILYALYNFRKIDADTKEGRQLLIDSFVNAIYLYDDKFVIAFNYKNKSKTVTFEEIESSSLTSKASPKISVSH